MNRNTCTKTNDKLRSRIRAFREEGPEHQLERSKIGLGLAQDTILHDPGQAHRLARALRMARRAALGAGADYDPVRHLVLLRLFRSQDIADMPRSDKIRASE